MTKDEVIERLKRHESEIRNLGVGKLYLFGSYARNEATQESDVDLFFDKRPEREIGFLEFTGLIIMLEDLFGTEVDVAMRDDLHPRLRADIEASAIRVI